MSTFKTQLVEIFGFEPEYIDLIPDNFEELRDKGGTSEKRVRWAEELRDIGLSHITPGQIERWVVTAEFLNLYTESKPGDTDALQVAKLLTALDIDGVRGLLRLDISADFEERVEHCVEENPSWKDAGDKLMADLSAIITWAESLPNEQLIETHTHNLLLMSDMHICNGIDQTSGKLGPNEDFLYDEAFAAFLAYHQDQRKRMEGNGTRKDRPWRLVMNGDVIDFLQIHEVPPKNLEKLLEKVCREIGELRDYKDKVSVDPNQPRAYETHRVLNDLKRKLEALIKDAPPDQIRQLCQLITEADILLARGDNAVDLGMLDRLENLVRKKTIKLFLEDAEWANDIPAADDVFESIENKFAQSDVHYQFQQSIQQSISQDLTILSEELGPDLEAEDEYEDWNAELQTLVESYQAAALERYYAICEEYEKNLDQYSDKERQQINTLRYMIAEWAYDEPDGDPYHLGHDDFRWGLSSNDVDNAWRVQRIYAGHPILFMAIAWFLAHEGNQIVIQVGNHDIEQHWFDVRQAFRKAFTNAFAQLSSPRLGDDWTTLFSTFDLTHVYPDGPQNRNVKIDAILEKNLVFSPWLYYEPGVVYAEHGCQYEPGNSWLYYLYPRFVGFSSGSIKDNRDRASAEDTIAHPKLFWPWGSLIVRFIFNRIEEIHPFADQVKPITRYFTWLFSKNFILSLWIMILTVPGMLKIAGQFFVRGVVEGWFGSLRTLSGVLNILVRGVSTWLTWMRRFSGRDWFSSQGRYKHPLRWPVLGWVRWWQIGYENDYFQKQLGEYLPNMDEVPEKIEKCAMDNPWYLYEDCDWEPDSNGVGAKKDGPGKFSQWWGRFTVFVTEAALQIGLLLLMIGLASLVTGWNPQMPTLLDIPDNPEAILYQTRGVCSPFKKLSISNTGQGLFGSFYSFPGLLLIIFGLIVLPVSVRGVLSWKKDEEQSTGLRAIALITLVPLILVIGVIFVRLRCNLSFASIKAPPTFWASNKDLAQWVFWLILLIVVVNLPVGDYWKAPDRNGGKRVPLFVRRNTILLILFVIATIIGLLAGLGHLLIAFDHHPSGLFEVRSVGLLGLLLVLFVGIISLYRGVFINKWEKIPDLIKKRNALSDLVRVILIGGIFVFALFLLPYLQEGANTFYRQTNWSWLPIWAIWGALGIWLLEPRDRDQPGKGQDTWMGKDPTNRWGWINDVLDGTFTMALEISVLIFLLGLLAQVNPLFLGQPAPRILAGFSGGRYDILQLVLFALLLLVIGSLGRSLVNLIRTEDIKTAVKHLIRKRIMLKGAIGVFAVLIILIIISMVGEGNNALAGTLIKILLLTFLMSIGARGLIELARNRTVADIVCRWRRRHGWLLDLSLGFGLLGLLMGSFFMSVGSGLLKPPYNLISIGLLALVGALGWSYTSPLLNTGKNKDSDEKEHPRIHFASTLISITGMFGLILSVVMILLSQRDFANTEDLIAAIRGLWIFSTVVIILGLAGLSFSGSRAQANHQRQVQVLNAASWGILLLAGILLSVNITVFALGYQLEGRDRQIPALVWKPKNDDIETPETIVNEAMFQLRLEQAVALSYVGFEPDNRAYLDRLEVEDKAMANYFRAIIDQPDAIAPFVAEIRSLTGDENHIIANDLESLANVKDGLSPEQMSIIASRLAQELNPLKGKYQPDDNHQARLAAIAVELYTLACQQTALTALAADYPPGQARDQLEWCALLSGGGLPEALTDRRDKLNQAWMARLRSTDDPKAALVQSIEDFESLDFDAGEIPWDEFGLWEKVYIVLWSGLRKVDLSSLVVAEPGAAKVSTDPTQLLQMRIEHRQAQLEALQLLQRALRQHQIADTLYWLAGIFFAALVLLGLSGYLVIALLTSSRIAGQRLTSAEQVKLIDELGQRHRSGFIRRVLRLGAVLLSFLFGAGLVLGAYIIATGLFRGDFITALRNGSILSILSLIGRRLVSLMPQGDSHGGGYLFDASVEIRQILNRGKRAALNPAGKVEKSLCWVPYIYLGHDHHAAFLRFNPEFSTEKWLPEKEIAPQWYVNTGSWVEAKSGEVRYRREDEAYAVYGLIVPGPDTTGAGASPTLLRWDIDTRRPARLDNLVSQPREAAPKRVFKVILGWLGLRQEYLDPPSKSTLE